MTDTAEVCEEIVSAADRLIRRRLEERGLVVPHIVVLVTPDDQVILRSNASPNVLRSFAENLIAVADEIEAESEPDTKH